MKTYTEKRFFEWHEDDVSVTIRNCGASYGGGSEVLIVSYQETTGCLSQGAHPGSYNGQDAYNDMLVTDESNKRWEWAATTDNNDGSVKCAGLYARCPSNHDGGG